MSKFLGRVGEGDEDAGQGVSFPAVRFWEPRYGGSLTGQTRDISRQGRQQTGIWGGSSREVSFGGLVHCAGALPALLPECELSYHGTSSVSLSLPGWASARRGSITLTKALSLTSA